MTDKPEKRPSKRTGGALTFIFACLLVSGIFRFGSGEFAIAKEVASLANTGEVSEVFDAVEIAQCTPDGPTGPLLKAIRSQQALLDEREQKFADRVQALNVAEMRLQEKTVVLIEAEKRLAATLAIADKAAENDLMRLTAVYENMKVKNAAGLFGEMAPEFAAGFLARMRADAAAGIMSNLTPEKAYTISLILAGRNARAPSK